QRVVANPIQKQVAPEAPAQMPATDKLELSGASHLLRVLKKNDIRADKVAQVKAQIEAGTYEDDKKLDAAVDRLLGDLLRETFVSRAFWPRWCGCKRATSSRLFYVRALRGRTRGHRLGR